MIAMLIIITFIISFYISSNTKLSIKQDLQDQADYILSTDYDLQTYTSPLNKHILKNLFHSDIEILTSKPKNHDTDAIIEYEEHNKAYIELLEHYPNSQQYLKIRRDITVEKKFLTNSYLFMIFIILLGMFCIFYSARILSKKIIEDPLNQLSAKLTNMNESMLQPIEADIFPKEFIPLSNSINILTRKIKTSIQYRKELYIGTAHELKTPLTVMRLKNQITLMKYKQEDNIRETLKQNIESIDQLNSIIHHILEYGRSEGAQFEKPKRLNLIRLIADKAEEYELLAHSQNRDFIYNMDIPYFMINIQPLLFMQIFQNFIQNALRFTPEGGLISVETSIDDNNFTVKIIDEGPGIDEKKNLFAPFERSTQSTGTGLGLFLAQNAADSMGVTIGLKNREDRKGAIANIVFPLNRFLLKD